MLERQAPAGGSDDESAGLDWQAFSTRYFPGRRGHDLEALTAYDDFKRRVVEAQSSAPEEARLVRQGTPDRERQDDKPAKQQGRAREQALWERRERKREKEQVTAARRAQAAACESAAPVGNGDPAVAS